MKHLFSALAFVLICLPVLPAFAGLEWKSQRIDHPASVADEGAEVDFKFTNTGDHSVTIESVRTSCGCTIATLDKKVYAPGESGEITAIFVFGDRVGKQRKRITVRTRETGEDGKAITESTALELRVTIPEAVKVRPRLVYWRQNEALAPKTIQITTDHDQPIRVTGVSSANDSVTAELKPVEEGKSYEIVLTPKQETATIKSTDTAPTDPTSGEPGDSTPPIPRIETRSLITIQTDYPPDNPRSYTVVARILGQPPKPVTTTIPAADTAEPTTTPPAATQPEEPTPANDEAETVPVP